MSVVCFWVSRGIRRNMFSNIGTNLKLLSRHNDCSSVQKYQIPARTILKKKMKNNVCVALAYILGKSIFASCFSPIPLLQISPFLKRGYSCDHHYSCGGPSCFDYWHRHTHQYCDTPDRILLSLQTFHTIGSSSWKIVRLQKNGNDLSDKNDVND